MHDKRLLIFPIIFALVLIPVMVVALLVYQPGDSSADCDCSSVANAQPHSHGAGLASELRDGMQLIMNVSAGAELYQLVDGKLELCGELTGDMKHVTVDVLDARFGLGERLPVTVELVIRRADTGETVVEATAPAMYAPGHGYHFGDNFVLPGGATYDWTFTISPVQALRQEGTQDLWLEPVEWRGSFTLDAEGNVAGRAASLAVIGDFVRSGLHVTLSEGPPVQLYAPDGAGGTMPVPLEPGSRYFVVDVTDHAVNYEEKLPGAKVTLTFARGGESFDVQAEPAISPVYGFHYGANVALDSGEWQITVEVGGLDFLRHAGAAVSLARNPISAAFDYLVPSSPSVWRAE
jgi:uncharacterized protein involved in high-affinity Fe2+ transport